MLHGTCYKKWGKWMIPLINHDVQWIGLLGKILTGNHRDFPMKIMGLSG